MAEPRIQYVSSKDGVRIAYTSVGQGDPFIFAANVWGDIELAFQKPSPIYGDLVEALVRNNHRVIVYDGRGCGASDRGVSDMSWAARLSDLEALTDRLALETFALFTVAHGCTTAIGYAARYPRRVTHLILESAYANGRDYYSRGPALRAIKALSDMADENWEFFTLTLTNWLTNFKSAEAAIELAATYRRSMDGDDYRRLIAGFEATDVTDLLGLVRAPTLVIQDANSPFRFSRSSPPCGR